MQVNLLLWLDIALAALAFFLIVLILSARRKKHRESFEQLKRKYGLK